MRTMADIRRDEYQKQATQNSFIAPSAASTQMDEQSQKILQT